MQIQESGVLNLWKQLRWAKWHNRRSPGDRLMMWVSSYFLAGLPLRSVLRTIPMIVVLFGYIVIWWPFQESRYQYFLPGRTLVYLILLPTHPLLDPRRLRAYNPNSLS